MFRCKIGIAMCSTPGQPRVPPAEMQACPEMKARLEMKARTVVVVGHLGVDSLADEVHLQETTATIEACSIKSPGLEITEHEGECRGGHLLVLDHIPALQALARHATCLIDTSRTRR